VCSQELNDVGSCSALGQLIKVVGKGSLSSPLSPGKKLILKKLIGRHSRFLWPSYIGRGRVPRVIP